MHIYTSGPTNGLWARPTHRHGVPAPAPGIGLIEDVNDEALAGDVVTREPCDQVGPVGDELGLAVDHGLVLGVVVNDDVKPVLGTAARSEGYR